MYKNKDNQIKLAGLLILKQILNLRQNTPIKCANMLIR